MQSFLKIRFFLKPAIMLIITILFIKKFIWKLISPENKVSVQTRCIGFSSCLTEAINKIL